MLVFKNVNSMWFIKIACVPARDATVNSLVHLLFQKFIMHAIIKMLRIHFILGLIFKTYVEHGFLFFV